ncbi:NUDIX domain-containing protein [Streptomyces sp. NPDC002536]
MATGDHFLVGAGVFIHHGDGRVLLVHHAKTGHWVIPGGKAECGETPRQCAMREAREETGLDSQPGRLLAVQHLTADRHWGNKYIADPYELFVFALRVDPGQYASIRVPDGEDYPCTNHGEGPGCRVRQSGPWCQWSLDDDLEVRPVAVVL